MDLKGLVWFFIFLTLSTSILSNHVVTSSTSSRDSKQPHDSNCRKSSVNCGEVERIAWSTRDQSVHAIEVQILNEYGNRVLPFYSKKRTNMKAKGRILASHHSPTSSTKNQASSLYQPSSFIFSMFPCIMIFAFFLLPL